MIYKIFTTTFLITTLFFINSCELFNPLVKNSKNKTLENNITVTIERTDKTIQGQYASVDISIHSPISEMFQFNEFHLLISYDAAMLTFQYAEPGQFLDDCGWEYFTYRYGPNGNCGTGCPTGEVRLTAIAEASNDNGSHPNCYKINESVSNQLTTLNFLVSNDRTFECAFASISFIWYDCADNLISNNQNNFSFIQNHIYNQIDTNTIDYTNDLSKDEIFPTYFGTNDSCEAVNTLRNINFINGGVDIVCSDSIDMKCWAGDLTNNGISSEIADAVLYSNYFVYGLQVFTADQDCQISASDVNGDGLTLTLADLVYLIRIIVGDALPYTGSDTTNPISYNVNYIHDISGTILLDNDITKIAAAHIVVTGEINPILLATNMTMISNFDGTNTNILIYSLENNYFVGEMVNVGNNEIVSIDMADAEGIQLVVTPLD